MQRSGAGITPRSSRHPVTARRKLRRFLLNRHPFAGELVFPVTRLLAGCLCRASARFVICTATRRLVVSICMDVDEDWDGPDTITIKGANEKSSRSLSLR